MNNPVSDINLMVDIETLAVSPNATILSIGACFFDPHRILEEFYVNIDVTSSVRRGFDVNGGTLAFWLKQPDEARLAIANGQEQAVDVERALLRFRDFVMEYPVSRLKVWSHGANFDGPILDNAFWRVLGQPAPWRFWNARDTRTLFDIVGKDLRDLAGAREGAHHNALADAIYQAKAVIAAGKVLEAGDEPYDTLDGHWAQGKNS